jgi:aspartyl-tRNA(Asn)/glutamyl-tRNA(Gln) amidotransferase subunit B
MAELPRVMAQRFVRDYGLPEYDATSADPEQGDGGYFEAAAKACGQPNWPATGSWAKCRAA